MDQIAVSLDDGMFAPGHAYTALSRTRQWQDVDISCLNRAAFSVDADAVKEYQRLEEKAAQCIQFANQTIGPN